MFHRSDPLPALRPVEARFVRDQDGRPMVALVDPCQFSPKIIALSYAGFATASLFNGQRTAIGVRQTALRSVQLTISVEEVLQLATVLDEALLLDSPRAAAAYVRAQAEYSAMPARPSLRPRADDGALRGELDRMLGDGRPADAAPALTGLIAPHLDYRRGAPCYADAYAAYRHLLSASPVERLVILGTNHFGRSGCACATAKDFDTPLGLVRTDERFVRRLEERLQHSLRDHELDHLREHSVELHAHILQHLHDGRTFEIVPVLCPSPTGPSGTRPHDGRGPDLNDFADALRDELAPDGRRTLVIASADLSHVGTPFGESRPATSELMQRVGEWDQSLLRDMEAGDGDRFLERVRKAGNPTRICSVGNLYVLARVLRGREFRVLRYHQASDFESDTHVTCAAGLVA